MWWRCWTILPVPWWRALFKRTRVTLASFAERAVTRATWSESIGSWNWRMMNWLMRMITIYRRRFVCVLLFSFLIFTEIFYLNTSWDEMHLLIFLHFLRCRCASTRNGADSVTMARWILCGPFTTDSWTRTPLIRAANCEFFLGFILRIIMGMLI